MYKTRDPPFIGCEIKNIGSLFKWLFVYFLFGGAMRRNNSGFQKKNLAPVIAVAGVLSLGAAPLWAQQAAQKNSPSSQTRPQFKGAGMITATDLQDHKVLDTENREVGTITNLFIDPQSGRIQRADIEFSRSVFGGDHKYSVAWEKLNVREQGNDVVVRLDESIIKRVQQAGASGRIAEGDGIYAQGDRREGVSGVGDSKDRQISASQLSSDKIRKIQQKLNQQGFDAGPVNGEWSSEAQTAVRNFQQMKGLNVTGQLDKRTLDEMDLDADEFRSNPASRSSGSMDKNR
jgi:sporulation protein YlmC with PRC-barrel domain